MGRLCGGSLVDAPCVLNHDSRYAFVASSSCVRVVSMRTGDTVRVLDGHSDNVVQVDISPLNMMHLLTVSADGFIRFWDYDEAICVKTLNLGARIASCFVVSDGDGEDTATIFWVGDTKKGQKQKIYKTSFTHTSSSSVVDLSNSSVLLQTVKTASLWCFHKRTQTFVFSNEKTMNVFPAAATQVHSFICGTTITSLAVSQEKDEVASGDKQGVITRWLGMFSGAESIEPLKSNLHWHAHAVFALAYTNDGEYLLSGGEEGVLVLWQVSTRSKRFLPRLGSPISHLAVTGSNTNYVVSLSNNCILVVGAASFEVSHKISGFMRSPIASQRSVSCGLVAHPQNQSLLITNGTQGQLQIFNVDKDEHVANIDVTGRNYISRTYHRQISPIDITHTAITSDGSALATVEMRTDKFFGNDLRMKFWHKTRSSDKFQVNTVVDPPHQRQLTSLCVHPNQPKFLSTSVDGTIKLWGFVPHEDDGKSFWRCEAVVDYNKLPCDTASFTPDGTQFVVACKHVVTVWETDTCELLRATELSNSSVRATSLCVSADGAHILMTTQSFVCNFDMATLDLVFAKKMKAQHLVVYSHNCMTDVDGNGDGGLDKIMTKSKLYAYQTGRAKNSFKVHVCSADVEDPIRTISFKHKPLAITFKQVGAFVCLVVLDFRQTIHMFLLTDDEEAQQEFATIEKRTAPLYGVEEDNAGKAYRSLFGNSSLSTATNEAGRVRTSAGESYQPVSVKDLFDVPSHLLPPVTRLANEFLDLMLRQRSAKNGTEEELAKAKKRGEEKELDRNEDTTMDDLEDEDTDGFTSKDEGKRNVVVGNRKIPKGHENGFHYDLHMNEQMKVGESIATKCDFSFFSPMPEIVSAPTEKEKTKVTHSNSEEKKLTTPKTMKKGQKKQGQQEKKGTQEEQTKLGQQVSRISPKQTRSMRRASKHTNMQKK
eukprot:m.89353 g.89353  ORF g.89353 m.89353 type:complete len:936 (-) comp12292_c0_seq1:59-2866(-)